DVDDVVGDNAEANPAVHSVEAFVAAAIETVSPLDHADAPLASGPPFLPIAEPALLLLAFALGAFAGAIGNAHALDAHRLRRRVVFGGIEGGVRRDQARGTSQLGLVCFDGGINRSASLGRRP